MKLARTLALNSLSLRAAGGGRADEPGMKAAASNNERFANPRYRPDRSVLRDELEPHIEVLAK
jgi:hypothetical protein